DHSRPEAYTDRAEKSCATHPELREVGGHGRCSCRRHHATGWRGAKVDSDRTRIPAGVLSGAHLIDLGREAHGLTLPYPIASLVPQRRMNQALQRDQESNKDSHSGHIPMSSFQMTVWSRMNRRIISMQRVSWSTSTTTPRSRSRSSSPRNVTFSPTTMRGMRYSRIAPEHMAHGDRVVYKTLRVYTAAGSRPAFSKASISPWRMALLRCTRRLCPRPMIWPP